METSLRIQREETYSMTRPESDLFAHLNSVYAYVVRRIGPVAVAEDICSEVFADAINAKRPKGAPLPWLYGIARRKIADSYRKRKIRRENPLDHAYNVASLSTHDQLLQEENALKVRSLVDGLHPDQREAILLFYVEDLTARQISESMGRSERAINSLLQRARANLRETGRAYFLEEN